MPAPVVAHGPRRIRGATQTDRWLSLGAVAGSRMNEDRSQSRCRLDNRDLLMGFRTAQSMCTRLRKGVKVCVEISPPITSHHARYTGYKARELVYAVVSGVLIGLTRLCLC